MRRSISLYSPQTSTSLCFIIKEKAMESRRPFPMSMCLTFWSIPNYTINRGRLHSQAYIPNITALNLNYFSRLSTNQVLSVNG